MCCFLAVYVYNKLIHCGVHFQVFCLKFEFPTCSFLQKKFTLPHISQICVLVSWSWTLKIFILSDILIKYLNFIIHRCNRNRYSSGDISSSKKFHLIIRKHNVESHMPVLIYRKRSVESCARNQCNDFYREK